jgi:hypothetical protein
MSPAIFRTAASLALPAGNASLEDEGIVYSYYKISWISRNKLSKIY